MADFCTHCAPRMWGPEIPADIDIHKIYEKVPNDHYMSVICEGCALVSIGRENDQMILGVLNYKDNNISWLSEDEFANLKRII
jgi:hypothetical protein